MSQTAYPTALVAALAGTFADIGPNRVRSMRNADAIEIAFGLGVTQSSSSDDAMKVPAASGDKMLGITAHTHNTNTVALTNTSAVEVGGRASVCEQGKMWVQVEGAVAANGAVFMRYATGGGGSVKGSFRADADTATASLVKGARFLTSTAGAGLAQIEFDAIAANT